MQKELLDLLNTSYTQYHAVNNMKNILLKEGFKELKESESYSLKAGDKCFVIRNLTSIIAFKIGNEINENSHFQIVASHSDSPNFKIKEHIYNEKASTYTLTVEPYGGLIHSCWLDKPLSIAGRIVTSKANNIKSSLFSIDKDLCIIPNLAIHMNREINNGFIYNPQIDLCPILGMKDGTNILEEYIKKGLDKDESLISYDLYLYNREKATHLGFNDEFIASPKLDDLASAYSTLKGFILGDNSQNINVFACFDNEEVGSMSINGADSTFLENTLRRIHLSLFNDESKYLSSLAKSSLISADNAHAMHPNHPEKTENDSQVLLNNGIVLKHNANMHYCSDALSSALIKTLGALNNLNIQEYFNRSDIRGGSTLGNISISHVSILSVDIGLPQLAMHSNYETMGAKDYDDMIILLTSYFSKNIEVDGENIKF